MAELIREQIFLDQHIATGDVQIMLEGDIIVPDTKPDLAVLLQTDEKITISRTEASTDRVNYVGELGISILYIAKEVGKTVQATELTRSIDDFVNIEGVTKDMWVRARAEIVNIDYRIVNDRKVNYRAVVNISVKPETSNAHEVVVHINDVPDNQLLKSTLNISRTAGNTTDRFHIKDQLTLPSTKPTIAQVLQVSANITSRDIRPQAGHINISGEVLVTTLYRADTEDSLLEILESELPFNGTIDVNGAKEDMLADVALQILEQNATIRPDEDGEDRILDLEFTIGTDIKVYHSETITVLADAYEINKSLNFTKTPVSYPQLVCVNRNQALIKGPATLPEGTPDMLQIFKIKGQVHMDDIRTTADKVTVEGAINADILYVAGSDDAPLASFSTVIPYRQVIEAKGATEDMEVSLTASIDHIAFSLLSPRETEARFQLTFNTQVVNTFHSNLITEVDVVDTPPEVLANQPSLRVYICQPGDSLWKIAKRFNVAINDLIEINDLEPEEKIVPGKKLLMVK